MKHALFLLTGLLFSFHFFSCQDENAVTCVRVSSEHTTQSRELGLYKGIFYDGVGTINISRANDPVFRANAPTEVLNSLQTEVRDDTLYMKLVNCFVEENFDLQIDITQPTISYIFTSGLSVVETEGNQAISTENLFLKMTGGGEMNLQMLVNEQLTTEITGTSEFSYGGFAKYHELIHAGIQDLLALDLQTNVSSIISSNSANSFVNVRDSLKGEIRSSGNIFYIGDPFVDVEISGSGEPVKMN